MSTGCEMGCSAAPADRGGVTATTHMAAAARMTAAAVGLSECGHRTCEDRPQHTDAEKNALALKIHACLLQPFNR
jgi:hypothetical protein